MNFTKDEKDSLRYLMNAALLNPRYELEGIISNNVSNKQFKKVLGRLNGNFKDTKEIERLDITFPKDSNYSNLRISIFGYYDINKFCKNEKLEGLKNIVLEEKTLADKEKINRLIINDYDIRFNLKKELQVNIDNVYIKDLFNAKKWREIPKVFRYKKIYQYKTNDGYSIDCSIVRSSQSNDNKLTVEEILKRGLVRNVIKPIDVSEGFKQWWSKVSQNKSSMVAVKNVYSYFKSVKESKVFENTMNYEIEVEYIGNTEEMRSSYKNPKTDQQTVVRSLLIGLIKYMTIILQCIQNSFYLTTTSETKTLFNDYHKMLKNKENKSSLFIGALPVDLQHKNCVQIPDNLIDQVNEPNIILDYSVCEKIDGERNLLYVDHKGECYLINRTGLHFCKAGLKLSEKYYNSIFDGEYLETDIKSEFINKLMIFDCYFFHGNSMVDIPFGDDKSSENSRYYYVRMLEKEYKGENSFEVRDGLSNLHFKLGFVQYLFGEKSSRKNKNHNLIFEQSTMLLDKMNVKYGGTLDEGHLFNYPTDGLIFMPTNRPLYNFNICDENGNNQALICNRKVNSYFKWKPREKLTIDFRVNIIKKGNERVYHYENGRKYAEVHLKSRNYDSFVYNKSGKQTVSSQMSSYLINENRNLYKEPEEINFIAVQPFKGERGVAGGLINTLYIAYLEVDKNDIIKCKNGDIIYDNDVVEMGYDVLAIDKIHFKKWIPERVRAGKVPNALNTAIDIWKLLHYSLSTENLMNGLTVSDMYNLTDKYLLTLSKKHTLQEYIDHSKKYLLQKFLGGMSKPKILDLGCGNMDYFIKYVAHSPSLIVGIDKNIDALNNKFNGAGSLLLNYSKLSPKVQHTLHNTVLINGDVALPLSTGESSEDNVLSSYYLDILYGRYKPEITNNQKLYNLYNQASNGFNIIVSFNVLEEIETMKLETYLYNVANNLREQGYFIGIMTDGVNVEKVLTEREKVVSGDELTWLLEKNNDVSFNIYYNHYNTVKLNYIVKFNELVSQCQELGMQLIDSKFLDEDLGELKSSFKKGYNTLEDNLEYKGWLNLQRYFIFQKMGSN